MKRLLLLSLVFAAVSMMVGCAAGAGYYYAPTPPPPLRAGSLTVPLRGRASRGKSVRVTGVGGGNAYAWVPGYWDVLRVHAQSGLLDIGSVMAAVIVSARRPLALTELGLRFGREEAVMVAAGEGGGGEPPLGLAGFGFSLAGGWAVDAFTGLSSTCALRPSRRGLTFGDAVEADKSSAKRIRSFRPRSVWAISRPRNCTTAFTRDFFLQEANRMVLP